VELLHGLLNEDAEGQRRLRRALGQALLKVTTVRAREEARAIRKDDDARRSVHGVHERDERGDPWHRCHALQDLRSPRLVVRIAEINAYNEEVGVDLEEETEPMVEYGDAAADAHRDLARSEVELGCTLHASLHASNQVSEDSATIHITDVHWANIG
jgi:hypothetical protein